MRRVKLLFVCCFALTLIGCVAVKKSMDNYEACKGDVPCMDEMVKAKSMTYAITKSATGPLLPSASEIIAVLVSNIVAFGAGAVHGGRKKGG